MKEVLLTFTNPNKHEPDNWSSNGSILTRADKLASLKTLFEEYRFLIIEHGHYRGARAPDRLILDDYDDFIDYLKRSAVAGDTIDIYDITELWKSVGDPVIEGKCPDDNFEVPEKGAY